jgi:hypothetical protein
MGAVPCGGRNANGLPHRRMPKHGDRLTPKAHLPKARPEPPLRSLHAMATWAISCCATQGKFTALVHADKAPHAFETTAAPRHATRLPCNPNKNGSKS